MRLDVSAVKLRSPRNLSMRDCRSLLNKVQQPDKMYTTSTRRVVLAACAHTSGVQCSFVSILTILNPDDRASNPPHLPNPILRPLLPRRLKRLKKREGRRKRKKKKEKKKKRKKETKGRENQLPKLISHGRVMESRNIPDGIYTSPHFIAAFNIETDLAIPDFN